MIDPPLYVQTLQYSARQDRFVADRIFTEGVSDVQAGELVVSQRATGANMSVDVAPGVAVIAGDSVANQGKYIVRCTVGENVVIPAPPVSDSRIDLVVLRVHDSTADGGDAALDGARLKVVAGVTSVVAANITDQRTQLNATTLKVATTFQSYTTAQRDALTGLDLFEGRTIWNTTTVRLESYHSGSWIPSLRTYQTTTVTSTGTWTPPTGVTLVDVVVVGGGGGGGSASASTGGGGGGGGRALTGRVPVSGTTAVVIGAGGSANAAGSSSSFGPYVAGGGDAGSGSGPGVKYSSGGSGSGSGNGAPGSVFGENVNSPGGGGGGGAVFTGTNKGGGGGGSSTAGGAGGTSADLGPGRAAAANTGGGGGGGGFYNSSNGYAGGAGGSGFVTIGWWSA